MTVDRDETGPDEQSSDGIEEFQADISADNFPDAIRVTSEAVTSLADRLNAVGLRIALIGNARSEPSSSANIESYLSRLSSLVDSAAAQMRFIQRLLDVIQNGVGAARRREAGLSNSPARKSPDIDD